MQAWKANKSMGKCRKMTYNGENGTKLGSSVENILKTQEMRAKAWEMQDRNHRKWYKNHGNMEGKNAGNVMGGRGNEIKMQGARK